MVAWRRPLAAISLLATGGLLLSGCGVVNNLTGDSEKPAESSSPGEAEKAEEAVEADFPYVREGRMFLDTGQDVRTELAITGLERTPDYTVLYYEQTYLDQLTGLNTWLSTPPTLIDPVSGQVFQEYTDDEGYAIYGSYGSLENEYFPVWEGVTNKYRTYFPRLPKGVKQVTFVGHGMGAMTGIPVQDVKEEQPFPEPNGAQYENTQPPEDEALTFEVRPPDGQAVENKADLESFVDSDIASTTRDGDEETVSLHSDVMFEFDESELTGDAEDVVKQAATTLTRNVDPENPEITVIGHTDGKGSDDYNKKLSKERAETVRDLLKDEVGDEFSFEVEARGSKDPVADEGGSDDEEARARNRRVEFSYQIDPDSAAEGSGEDGDGSALDAAERNVAAPAPFAADDGEVVASTTKDDVKLDVHPLRRDGGYVIGTVSLTNTSDEPIQPDMGGEDSLQPGGPAQFSEGALGGFQLLDPGSDLVRYVAQMKFSDDEYMAFAEEVHELQPGEAYRNIAVFPAPPSDATEMTLRAGPFGELENVPIQ